jgi:energy-coupling factor transporter ATP-binding protein EcfA2
VTSPDAIGIRRGGIYDDHLEPVLSSLDTGIIPTVDWQTCTDLMTWEQGEHAAVIGPTGQGKTTLALALLHHREYVTVFATKPQDTTLERFAAEHAYSRHSSWPREMRSEPSRWPWVKHSRRRIIWPDARRLDSAEHQRDVFQKAMADIYIQGGWAVYFDELFVMAQQLKLAPEVKTYLMQGRSLGISTIIASQRPAWIPLEVYDQSTHLFFCRDNDETNLKRISGVGFLSSRQIRETIPSLRKHEFLYINTRDGVMAKTTAPLNSKRGGK